MAHTDVDMNAKPGQLVLSTRIKTIYSICMFVGLATFLVGLNLNKERVWMAYLVSLFFFVSLSLGGLFFTALQHVSNAGWSVNIRRLPESMTAFLPFGLVLSLGLLAGGHHIYEWFDSAKMHADPILVKKTGYLNITFFVIRLLVFFGLWLMFSNKIICPSLEQDKTGDESITHKMVPWSVGFLVAFALSYSLFSVDTLMSLDPHWYSTMYGVYAFAGLFQASLAFIILLALWVRSKGLVNGFIKLDHMHDLGKFLKGFTIFMAYIGFSQFMLIWYANIPEETEFFLNRAHGKWMWISLGLLIFKFIVPFLALLPKWAKRSTAHLAWVSMLILTMEYVDIYWLVYPNLNDVSPMFNFIEIGIFLGFLGVFAFAVTKFLSKYSLIPMKDPRRHESMAHVVTY
jgi:hypothetical protein